MCPDRDLVSAYVDGEVPSPWRERIEEHLGSCQSCAALVSGYLELGSRLRAEGIGDESALLERGRARLESLLEGLPAQAEAAALGRHMIRKAWERRISLPLPIAAAAALLALLLGGTATIVALKPNKDAAIQAIASGEIAQPPSQVKVQSASLTKAQPASMDELLRYLDANDAQVTLTIKLPSGTTFGRAGDPVIMRSGQTVRPQLNGTTVGGQAP
jgi:anti-sigma factor RsiW